MYGAVGLTFIEKCLAKLPDLKRALDLVPNLEVSHLLKKRAAMR